MDEFEKDMELEENQESEVFAEEEIAEELVEEEPAEVEKPEPKPAKKKKRKLKKFAKYILIFLLILVAVGVYRMLGCNKLTVSDMYKFEGDASNKIAEYEGKALSLDYDGVRIIGVDGKESVNIEYHMANPHMDVSETMILLYDKDEKKLAVFEDTKRKYSYTSERSIKSAKVNKNGYVVLVSDESGFNYKVSVLNDKGEEEYLWKIGNEYLVDVDISPDGKKLAAATITTDTGHVVQNVVMIDVDKAEELGRTTTKDVMPLSVNFTENGSAVVISDDRICGYDTKARIKWEEGFENRLLDNFATDEEGNTVLALRGIKNNSVICVYTKSGRKSKEYTTDTKVTHLDLNSKHIAVCEYNKISLINYSGKVVTELEIQKEVFDVAVINNNKIIVLCKDCIQLLRM